MPKCYSIKTCSFCGHEGRRAGAKYCSVRCQQDAQYQERISLWLNGELSGLRGNTGTAAWIKRYLIELNGEKCERCGWADRNEFTGNIPIELDHIDGDYTNNRPDNVRLLCPNCHSLTKTYKGANKHGRPRSKYYRGT